MSLVLSTGAHDKWLGDAAGSNTLKGLLEGGVLRLFSGTPPVDADAAETGTLLAELSQDGLVFVPDTGSGSTNGLQLLDATGSQLAKSGLWAGDIVATDTATWGRIYDSVRATGVSAVAVRGDVTVGLVGSGADIELTIVDLTSGLQLALSTAYFQLL